jgi:mono/diheme cytochrome c family protein
VLAPQASTTLRVSLDLTGKIGAIAKTVTVESSVGFTQLHVRANIPARPATGVGNLTLAREKNIEIAFADRQAVFRGDCMKCHATPAKGKLGEELYLAACTLCHDASPRASMIPDLNSPRGPRDLAFWMKWIGEGGPGTMMPAFAAEHGGPLNEEQICSLARYAYDACPKEPLPPAGDAGAKTP